MRPRAARGLRHALALVLLAGCATPSTTPMQTIEVQLDLSAVAWTGPLRCEASNAQGRWPFEAPGKVEVRVDSSPLHLACQAPEGSAAVADAPAMAASEARRQAAREGASTGAKVGGAVGVAAAAVTAPVVGPALAAVLVVGGVLRGREVGGAVGAIGSAAAPAYPSRITIRVELLAAKQ